MKSFRTELSVAPGPFEVKLSDAVLTLGSCFSDSIGQLLMQNKFTTLVNPMGTVYNPISIHKLLNYAAGMPIDDHWCNHQQLWSHFDFHSSFNNVDKTKAENAINATTKNAGALIQSRSVVILTYGTAWVFKTLSSDNIVANCHKQPSQSFSKTLLSADEIVTSFKAVYESLKVINPDLRFILTLSPVRHLKDSLEGNSVSKSVLRVAINAIIQQYPEVDYFPAYEIMLDDLRDYRFFEADMIHPSKEAIHYIWEKFTERYFDSALKELLEKWTSVTSALHHRPFHPGGDEHVRFLRSTLKRLEELKPFLNVEEEIGNLRAQLAI